MADFHTWIGDAAVVIGLGITAASFWRDANQRELSNILTFDDKHETLWKELWGREDLRRIHLMNVDLKKDPPTDFEVQALIRAFVSYQQGWKAARLSDRSELDALRRDIANFLRRPLPRLVWEQEKIYRVPKFVRFVERALERGGHFSA